MGAAFKAVVDGLVTSILEPFVAMLFGQPDLSHVGNFTLRNVTFSVGVVLTALFHFLLVAAAVYFFIVTPINKLRATPEEEKSTATDIELLAEIRDLLKNQQR